MVSRLIHNVVPQIERHDEQGYPMPVVIRFLLQHVEDMMAAINLSEGQLLRLVTDRQLVTKIGSLNLQQMADIGRFLGSYIVLSQVFFLRLLATARPDLNLVDVQPVTRDSLRRAFRRVLDINYRHIYEVDVLDSIPEDYLQATFDLIWGLAVERNRYELPGRIFHELMPSPLRKMLAAFYTRPQAAELLAALAINHSDATVFDPACGSGTILTAAYRRKRELYEQEHAGNPHRQFCEHDIFGADLMPFAAHLTTANLAAMEPGTIIDRTQVMREDSLRLIPGRSVENVMQLGLGGELFQQASREAERISGESYQVDLTTVGVVMMNPPFTKTERGIRQYVNMDRYQSITGGAVGLWGHFLALANQFVEPGGIVAAVIPINFLRGTESRRVRELTFTDWTPLYILKPTVNYGFSEWSEYRDIIFIAQKGAPAPNHQVRFALVKQDLTRLDTEAANHTATRIQALQSLRSADLDIQSFGIDTLRERFSNLMWFCGVSSFAHRDTLLSFIKRFAGRLQRFPAGYFREGYRPVPAGVSKFLFLTRNLEDSRVEYAFLRFDSEEGSHTTTAHSRLGVPYILERSALVPSLRTGVGLRRLSIEGRWDYIAAQPYRELQRVARASGFGNLNALLRRGFWENVPRELGKVQTHLMVVHRINPYSPHTYLTAFFSDTPISPSNVLNVVVESDPRRAKAVCVLFNSILFLTQFFLSKEETTGRNINVRFYDLYEMALYPRTEVIGDLVSVFDGFADQEFPSLREQLDQRFDERYEAFWQQHRTGQLPLDDLFTTPGRPSPLRVAFDRAVCQALGVAVTDDELRQVYDVIVREMIVTRGLQRD